MSSVTGFVQANLMDLIETLGEERVLEILSSFSCPKNADVECFLQTKAIMFAKMGIAATHLVFASYRSETVLVGYYSLANKTVIIKGSELNSRWKRRLGNFAQYNPETRQYCIALPLIGQLGKNFSSGYNQLITGDDLLGMACEKIRGLQQILGGKIAYLECEDTPRLIEFYRANGFERFANRNLDRDELQTGEKPYLVQMLRYFSSKERLSAQNPIDRLV